MRIMVLISEATSSLRANRVRFLLSLLGMATGVATVSLMIAIGEGARIRVDATVRSLGSDLLFARPSPDLTKTIGKPAKLGEDDAAVLSTHAEIIAAAPLTECKREQVKSSRYNSWPCIFGTSSDLIRIRRWNVRSGTGVFSPDQRQAVLGEKVARELFPDEDPIGQRINTPGGQFQVIGVLEGIGLSSSGVDQDDSIYLPLKDVLVRFKSITQQPLHIDQMVIKAVHSIPQEAAKRAVQDAYRQIYKLHAFDDEPMSITDIEAITRSLHETRRTTSLMLAGIASVSLLVAGIGIMNIMYVSVRERTREIGLRMAVGASRRDIVIQFQLEAVGIGLAGGCTGIALSRLLSVAVRECTDFPIQYNLIGDSLLLIAAVAVGFVFGTHPAHKAASLHPTVALRG